jgi:hypothetical protein
MTTWARHERAAAGGAGLGVDYGLVIEDVRGGAAAEAAWSAAT